MPPTKLFVSNEDIKKRCIINENGCWVWQGAKDSRGYGQITINKKTIGTHVATYSNIYGVVPGKEIHHTCPNNSCCNPEHLERLSKTKHRQLHGDLITHCPKDHLYSGDNVSYSKGYKYCKICQKARNASRIRRNGKLVGYAKKIT